MALPILDNVTLNTGHKMPIIGLGTWQSTPAECKRAIDAALDMGYRHIDTAFMYFNEADIGKALKEWFDSGKLKREDLFVTTKLPMNGMRKDLVGHFVQNSLTALQLDYLDCYLIHSPIGVKYDGNDANIMPMVDGKLELDMETDLIAIWNALEDEVDAGRIRTIGVSNFNIEQIQRVNKAARKYKIAVQQIELHAFFQQKEMQAFCSTQEIAIMAYGPLGSPGREQLNKARGITVELPNLLDDPRVKKIAATHRVTTAQVLLHHLAQKGLVVIPKSVTPARIQVNYQIFNFTLSPSERDIMDKLDDAENGRSFNAATFAGANDHPEFFLPK